MEHYQIFKPKTWIPLDLLDDHHLCANPKAVGFLEEHPERICCKICLSTNPSAIPFLRKHPEYIHWIFLAANPEGIGLIQENWEFITSKIFQKEDHKDHGVFKEFHPALSIRQKKAIEFYFLPVEERSERMFWNLLALNPNAVSFLQDHLEKVNWKKLTYNPNSLPLFEKHPEKVQWDMFQMNPNPVWFIETFNPDRIDDHFWSKLSLSFVEKNIHRVDWMHLTENPNALPVLNRHPDKICWIRLCNNPNPKIMSLVEQNLDKINWCALSRHPDAIPILKKNLDKVDWNHLCRNPNGMRLFLAHPEKITERYQWLELCKNPNVHLLIPLLNQNLYRLDDERHWFNLMANEKMEDFIRENASKIDWTKIWFQNKYQPVGSLNSNKGAYRSIWILETYGVDLRKLPKHKKDFYLEIRSLSLDDISLSPHSFDIDKEKLRSRISGIREELEAVAYSPERIAGWKSMGYDLEKCI